MAILLKALFMKESPAPCGGLQYAGRDSEPGAQTERSGAAGPVRVLLGGDASPAAFISVCARPLVALPRGLERTKEREIPQLDEPVLLPRRGQGGAIRREGQLVGMAFMAQLRQLALRGDIP